jgi:DNA primase
MSSIDEVKQRLDIVQVVSEYVSLRKSGRNFKALCPFHNEKSPSFFIFPERQSWHCFGACGTGGDIITFVMKKEGLDFGQALRVLAAKAGVTLVTQSISNKKIDNTAKERLFAINEAAAEYYHHLLLNAASAKRARDYATQRGLSPQTIKDFQLGYSPEGWEALRQYLMEKGYEEDELIAGGLLVKREDKGSYDRFRDRLMFPIRDIQSRVIGFGARALDDSLPKYLNSPQTLVFDKSSTLYGIDRAKTAIRQKDQAIIVEGYVDVIMVHQYGWQNVIAFMGTALTEKQLSAVQKLTNNVILALDADEAGKEAIFRSGETVDRVLPVSKSESSEKYDVSKAAEAKILVLPQGKDPDEVIKEDISQWATLVRDAKPMVDFIFENEVAKVDADKVADKVLVLEKLLPLLYQIKDPIRQLHYIEKLARLLRTDEQSVGYALRKFKLAQQKRWLRPNLKGLTPATLVAQKSNPIEEYCLALLLQYQDLKPDSEKLMPDYFEDCGNRELFLKWQHNDTLDFLKDHLDVTLHEYVDTLLAKDFPPPVKDSETARQKTLNDCILRLQEKWLKNMEAKKEQLLLTEAESGGTAAQLAKLKEQGIEESKQLKEVFIKQRHKHKSLAGSKEE